MDRSSRRAALAIALLVALAAGACSGSGSGSGAGSDGPPTTAAPARRASVPGAEWQKVDPAAVGLDPARLDAIAATAEAGKSNCLVVVRDGKLAGEWYFRGTGPETDQEVFSATKSYSSTLVGIAQDDGDLRIADSASRWVAEWRDTPAAAVTVRNLVSNDSGREWSLAIDYGQMLAAPNKTQFAIDLPQQHPPGRVWAYNNSAIQTLQRVLERATGRNVVEYAHDRLLAPIGMTHSRYTTDPAGNELMFMGLRSTCRDMARFGLLMLDHGRWGDEQVVSADWVRAATGRSSTPLNAAYGYLWWLNRPGVIASPLAASSIDGVANPTTVRGQMVQGAPADTFWAIGLGNQIIQVDPGSRTVVVRLGTAEPRPTPPTFGPAEASRVVTEAVTR
jgi:CubicO group peptidase (beta-lactamase class C family)